jgi:Tfp pilus assembly PilM family ATPase
MAQMLGELSDYAPPCRKRYRPAPNGDETGQSQNAPAADNNCVMPAEKIVALDIGSSSLKAVEATVKKGAIKFSRIYTLPIDAEIVSSGKIVNPEFLENAIRRLWRIGRFSTRNVALLAAGNENTRHSVISELPYAKYHADFKRILPFELAKKPQIAQWYGEGKDYYVDAYVLDKTTTRTGDTLLKALVTFLPRNYVDSLIKVIEAAKLMPIKMDTLPFSLIRAYVDASAEKFNPEEIIVSVELGASAMNVTIHKNSQPIYIYTLQKVGGRYLTDLIAQQLQINFAQAEYLKLAISTPDAERANLAATMITTSEEARTYSMADFSFDQIEAAKVLIRQHVSNLIQTLQRILQKVSVDLHEDEDFNRIVVSGGSAKLYGFVPRLASQLEVEAEILNPFQHVKMPRVQGQVAENLQAYTGLFGLLVEQNRNG